MMLQVIPIMLDAPADQDVTVTISASDAALLGLSTTSITFPAGTTGPIVSCIVPKERLPSRHWVYIQLSKPCLIGLRGHCGWRYHCGGDSFKYHNRLEQPQPTLRWRVAWCQRNRSWRSPSRAGGEPISRSQSLCSSVEISVLRIKI